MNEEPAESGAPDSRNCVVVFIDGPGDRTRRPITDPKRLAILKAEREKMERYNAMMNQPQDNQQRPPTQRG